VDDLLAEVKEQAAKGGRVLITVLTKKMAEQLTEYLGEMGVRVRYLHSDVDTLERIEIIRDLRAGCSTRWWASTCCARARHPRMHAGDHPGRGQGGLPALHHRADPDHRPGGAQRGGARHPLRRPDDGQHAPRLEETERRRNKQLAYNEEHGITPQTIVRGISDVLKDVSQGDYVTVEAVEGDASAQFVGKDLRAAIAEMEKKMRAAAADLEFEQAGRYRDEIKRLEAMELGLDGALAPNMAWRSLQDATPRAQGRNTKKDWKPKPMGPGGGGYDPNKVKGRGRKAG
jgi:excinuclease ABC subunit B